MNLFLWWNVFSFRKELTYLLTAFLFTLSLPIIAVILLTHAGIDIISDRLVTENEISASIEIHDPLTGGVVKTLRGPFYWPTTGIITLEFGESSLYQPFHTGIDIASNRGDPITPFMPGKVVYAGEIFWGFGKHIIIDHGDNVTTVYAHLDRIFVVKGQDVVLGQVIGREGSTGWSTGPHLHFQIKVFGIPVNPRTFLQ
ncbi:MAG: hypothetical protein A2857_00320 [Candidatus Levybacteria bacterium RIFCSPHIGHO2_01_FULL_36_15]|nr:MAG: hypothetical protein A2857_00320 [Candidatus Levybacteria bacterium RIFCSPHIGHO2_01_FULL_36_15]